MNPQEVLNKLIPHLVTILRIPMQEIHANSSFYDDLNAESIDIAELEVVLEEVFGVETSDERIEAYMMGQLTNEEFYDEEHVVTPAGLERVAAIVPGLDSSRWSGELNRYNLWRVLTVDLLCRYVSDWLRETPSHATTDSP